jgi:hypothetical protein
MRGLGPIDRDGVSAFYKLVNAGKTVVRLDLRAAAGRAAFTALVRAGDVLIESFRPGALARLGFGPEALKELNPRLVHTALSGYGQSGPYAGRAGHDLNYMALAGGLATSGTAARPVMAHPPTADFAGGMQAALVALAGLLRRDRSGAGGFFDVSLSESVLAWQAMALTAARRPGFAPQRAAGLLNGGAACYHGGPPLRHPGRAGGQVLGRLLPRRRTRGLDRPAERQPAPERADRRGRGALRKPAAGPLVGAARGRRLLLPPGDGTARAARTRPTPRPRAGQGRGGARAPGRGIVSRLPGRRGARAAETAARGAGCRGSGVLAGRVTRRA